MSYALIENGIVVNLIWLNPANAFKFPNAIQIDDIPVAIGDEYIDGCFYRNGEEVLSVSGALAKELSETRETISILLGEDISI